VRVDREIEAEQKKEWVRFTNKDANIDVLIDSEPEVEHEEVNITGTLLSDSRLKLLFTLPRYPQVSIGDRCRLKGEIYEPESFEEFDYKEYLRNKRVYRIMRVKQSECAPGTVSSLWLKLKVSAVRIKSYFIAEIDKSLPEPQSSLLTGIIFGQKRAFGEEFDEAIRNAGVSHVVAASGYNISFVVGISSSLLRFLDQRKRLIGAMVLVWIYCVMSGLSPSIVRAGLMYTVAKGSSYFGFYIPILNIMVFTLFLFVLIDPRIPFDVGFQLSYLATLGLIYVLLGLQTLIKKIGIAGLADSILLPTLACTLTTLPITVITFRKLPLLSIVVNALVLPVIDSVLILGVASMALFYTFPLVSRIIYLVIWFQLKYFEQVVLYFGKMSWGVLSF
jgi:competence protein ComEC